MTQNFLMEKLALNKFLLKSNSETDSVCGAPLIGYKGIKDIKTDCFLPAANRCLEMEMSLLFSIDF